LSKEDLNQNVKLHLIDSKTNIGSRLAHLFAIVQFPMSRLQCI